MALGDFPRDPTVQRVQGKGGPPPDGHPRRCQSKTRQALGDQCGQWALRGEFYCKFHRRSDRRTPMKGYYTRHLKGRLRDMIVDAENDEQRQSLAGEVDAARGLCQEAMRVCAIVMDPPKGVDGKTIEVSAELRMSAVQVAQNSLEHVSKVVERMTKVLILSDATFDERQVDSICGKIINILFEHLEDEHPEKLKEIVDTINAMSVRKKPDVTITIT